MSVSFPAALDTFVNPSSSNPQNNPSHSQQHADANDAIEALEAKVGIDGSANPTSLDYRVSQLEAGGGSGLSIVTKTSAYTATTDDDIILCDASGGEFSITLPPAASATGKAITVKKIDDSDNFITIQADTTETIDGRNTQILPVQYNSMRCVSNGTAWFIVP